MADDKLDTLLEQLRDDDPKARRKAITQLVKHGNPEAIIDISNVYRQADEDPKVREAAAKALKYFAAREKSQGRLAKMLGLARIVLVVSLVIVLGANIAVRVLGGAEDEPFADVEQVADGDTPVQVAESPDEVFADFTNNVVLVALDDLNALRTEWQAESLPCTAELSDLPSFQAQPNTRENYPELADSMESINEALDLLSFLRAQWQTACTAPTEMSAQDTQNTLDALNQVEMMITTTADEVTQATANAQSGAEEPTEAEVPPTLVPTDVPLPTETPLPPIDASLLRDLERIAGNGQAAMNSLIQQRWQIVQQGETSAFGCSSIQLDDDYAVEDPALLAPEPALADTIALMNDGLALARASAELYVSACQQSAYTENTIQQGLSQAQQALQNFNMAAEQIDNYQATRSG